MNGKSVAIGKFGCENKCDYQWSRKKKSVKVWEISQYMKTKLWKKNRSWKFMARLEKSNNSN